MTETKFKTMLQEYTDTPVVVPSFAQGLTCSASEKLKAYGLYNLWKRAVLHSLSQNGVEWFTNAIMDDEPLCALFDWKHTEEGYTFWRKVYKRICCDGV